MKLMRIAVCGLGQLGSAAVQAVQNQPDFQLVSVFTRRPEACQSLFLHTPVYHTDTLAAHSPEIDAVILCGSSAYDLASQSVCCAPCLCFVDSFDMHAQALEHSRSLHTICQTHHTTGIACAGWDPGLFSVMRTLMQAVFPQAHPATFWGPGVSQGHSAALRGIAGVADAIQYTVPHDQALEQAYRPDSAPAPDTARHRRICYIVPQPGADTAQIQREVCAMPAYFQGYDTEIHFVSSDELTAQRTQRHGGRVLESVRTPDGTSHTLELALTLGSNPVFTAYVLCACARAAVRLCRQGTFGCFTMPELPPALLCAQARDTLLQSLL